MYVSYYLVWKSIVHYTIIECSIRAACHHNMSNRNHVVYYEYFLVKLKVNLAIRMQENVFQRKSKIKNFSDPPDPPSGEPPHLLTALVVSVFLFCLVPLTVVIVVNSLICYCIPEVVIIFLGELAGAKFFINPIIYSMIVRQKKY